MRCNTVPWIRDVWSKWLGWNNSLARSDLSFVQFSLFVKYDLKLCQSRCPQLAGRLLKIVLLMVMQPCDAEFSETFLQVELSADRWL